MSRLSVQEAAALLAGRDNLLILTHRRPDGDTMGCAAGLCAALRQLGKRAFVLRNPEASELNAVYAAPYWAPEDFSPDFVVSVDIAARSLFYPAAEAYFDRIGLAVDHHPSFEGFGEASCVDASRAACGEIVYEICRELGPVTPEIALPLYAAVATDTGCFVYANTTAATHRTAAALLETGIDYFSVNKRHFRTKSPRRIALEAALYQTLEYFHEGRGVFLTVPLSLMEELGAAESDAEDLSASPPGASSTRRPVEGEPSHRGQRPGERHGGLPATGRRRPRHGRRRHSFRLSGPGEGAGPGGGGRGQAPGSLKSEETV